MGVCERESKSIGQYHFLCGQMQNFSYIYLADALYSDWLFLKLLQLLTLTEFIQSTCSMIGRSAQNLIEWLQLQTL